MELEHFDGVIITKGDSFTFFSEEVIKKLKQFLDEGKNILGMNLGDLYLVPKCYRDIENIPLNLSKSMYIGKDPIPVYLKPFNVENYIFLEVIKF